MSLVHINMHWRVFLSVKTILISNRKGGTGKTTTAVNLAGELAKTNSVLLIDFDTQGHSGIGVGLGPNESCGSHQIFQGKTLSETFMPTVIENLTLSPALEFFDVYDYGNLQGVLKKVYDKEQLNDFFDYCIIDTAPMYDSVLKNSLEVADVVVVPVVPHHLGVIGAQQMFRAIYQMSMDVRGSVPYVGILPVLYNKHLNEHKEAIDSLGKSFGKEKLFSPIGVDIHLASQFKEQKPLVLTSRRKRGAIDYKKFTEDLKRRLKDDQQ